MLFVLVTGVGPTIRVGRKDDLAHLGVNCIPEVLIAGRNLHGTDSVTQLKDCSVALLAWFNFCILIDGLLLFGSSNGNLLVFEKAEIRAVVRTFFIRVWTISQRFCCFGLVRFHCELRHLILLVLKNASCNGRDRGRFAVSACHSSGVRLLRASEGHGIYVDSLAFFCLVFFPGTDNIVFFYWECIDLDFGLVSGLKSEFTFLGDAVLFVKRLQGRSLPQCRAKFIGGGGVRTFPDFFRMLRSVIVNLKFLLTQSGTGKFLAILQSKVRHLRRLWSLIDTILEEGVGPLRDRRIFFLISPGNLLERTEQRFQLPSNGWFLVSLRIMWRHRLPPHATVSV